MGKKIRRMGIITMISTKLNWGRIAPDFDVPKDNLPLLWTVNISLGFLDRFKALKDHWKKPN